MIPYRIFLTNFHLLISFQIKLIPLFLSPALTSSFFYFFIHFLSLRPSAGVRITSVLNRKNGFAVGKIGAKVAVA